MVHSPAKIKSLKLIVHIGTKKLKFCTVNVKSYMFSIGMYVKTFKTLPHYFYRVDIQEKIILKALVFILLDHPLFSSSSKINHQ